jgi:hypothetical protein
MTRHLRQVAMTASYVALYFVLAVLFTVLQFLYHDQFRTEIRLAFHYVTNVHKQLHTEYLSDRTRFPIMSSDGKLLFDSFPTNPLDFSLDSALKSANQMNSL